MKKYDIVFTNPDYFPTQVDADGYELDNGIYKFYKTKTVSNKFLFIKRNYTIPEKVAEFNSNYILSIVVFNPQ